MKLGQQALEALQAEITGRIYPGDDLVVAGETGISGTLELICREWDKLRTYFSESFLRMGVETLKNCMISEEDVFWKEAGMDVDLRRIPIRQETIEVCERLDVDPYKLEAKGSVLIGTAQGDALVRELEAHGIHAAVIGYADSGNDRLLHSGEITRYLERPRLHLTEIIPGKDRKDGKA